MRTLQKALALANPVALRRAKYADQFGYDRGDDFPCDLGGARREVSIRGGRGRLVEAPDPAGARFLALRVRSTWRGGIFDPSVTVHDGDRTVEQFLERDARGRRYINISDLRGPALRVQGRHAVVDDQVATLHTFAPVPIEAPILVLAPHPDDAEIAAFGLYADRDAWVVTATVGEVGTTDFGGLFTLDEAGATLRARTRVWESISVPGYGGIAVSRCLNLGYADGSLDRMRRGAPGSSTQIADFSPLPWRALSGRPLPPVERPQWSSLVSDLGWLLTEVRPRTVVCPHPRYDTHPDHQALSIALLQACQTTGHDVGRLFFYIVHPPGAGTVNIHPVGPPTGVVSVPPVGMGQPLDALYHHPLDDTLVRRKKIALDGYRDIREPETHDGVSTTIFRAARDVYRRLVVYDSSFQRKAARPNELFVTHPAARASELLTAPPSEPGA